MCVIWCKIIIFFLDLCCRKAMLTWKNQIRISTDNGLEGNSDDGYSWRKYGQKDILGAKFPRLDFLSFYPLTCSGTHSIYIFTHF